MPINKYCMFKNDCKYPDKCCAFCKHKCDIRCTDNNTNCKYSSNCPVVHKWDRKTEPIINTNVDKQIKIKQKSTIKVKHKLQHSNLIHKKLI